MFCHQMGIENISVMIFRKPILVFSVELDSLSIPMGHFLIPFYQVADLRWSHYCALMLIFCSIGMLHAQAGNDHEGVSPIRTSHLMNKRDTAYEALLRSISKNINSFVKKKTSGEKSVPNSLKYEIERILFPYDWKDTTIRVLAYPENITDLPRFTGTVWNNPLVTGFVKCGSGCKKVTLIKRGHGFSGHIRTREDTLNDTIHISDCTFHLSDRMLFDSQESMILTKRGDTVSRWGKSMNEPIWNLRSVNNDYMEFSDFPGTQVTLRAQGAMTDTIVYHCPNRNSTICIKKRGIDIVICGDGILSASVHNDNRSIMIEKCIARCNEPDQIDAAIYLVNSFLKGKRFIALSDEKGIRIHKKLSACRNDTNSLFFPYK